MDEAKEDSVLDQAKLILAEKRTNLAMLRTGIAVLALPLGVVSFLIALSRYYHALHNLHYLVPLLGLCLCLAVLGAWLVIRAVVRMRRDEVLLKSLKAKSRLLACLDDESLTCE